MTPRPEDPVRHLQQLDELINLKFPCRVDAIVALQAE